MPAPHSVSDFLLCRRAEASVARAAPRRFGTIPEVSGVLGSALVVEWTRHAASPGPKSAATYRTGRCDHLIDLALTANAQRINPSDFALTHAASATTLPGRNCQDVGVREIRIGHAVGRAARCGSLTLLVAGEPTIARASIVIALQAIPILACCNRGYASCEDGRRRREGKKEGDAFFSPTLRCPT